MHSPNIEKPANAFRGPAVQQDVAPDPRVKGVLLPLEAKQRALAGHRRVRRLASDPRRTDDGTVTDTRIAHLRQQRGWTQQRLATESRVGVRTLQRLEAGGDASLQTLERVAAALGLPVAELFVPEAVAPQSPPRTGTLRRAGSVAAGRLARVRAAARRSLALVLVLALLGAAAGFAVALTRPPAYQATAKAFVGLAGVQLVHLGDTSFSERVARSYADVAATPIVLNRVAADLPSRPALENLSGRITVTVVPGSALMVVTARSSTGAEAARTADLVVQELIRVSSSLTPRGSDGPLVHITAVERAKASAQTPSALEALALAGSGALAGLLAAVLVLSRRPRPPGGSSSARIALA